jgi:hypothetical protein
VSTGTVANVLRTLPPDLLEKDKPVEVDQIELLSEAHKQKFQHLRERFKQWVGDAEKAPSPPKAKNSSTVIAAVCNDIHAPFHNGPAFARFIADNRDADECWVVGDVLDLFGVSKYPKTRQIFSLVEEFQAGQAIMRTLSESFPKIKVLHGNHDDRWIKYLVSKNIPPDVLEFLRFVYPHIESPLAKICSQFPNIEMMEPKRVDFAKYPFVHQIGDCALSHTEKFSKISMKTTADVIDWVKSYAEPMGILHDVKFLVQAHTHMAGKAWFGYGVVGIEAGCMALNPDYAGNAQLKGSSKPPVTGYSRVVQVNGVTDRNLSQFVEIQ